MTDIGSEELSALEWIARGGEDAVIDGSKLPALERQDLVALTDDGWLPTARGLQVIARHGLSD